MAYQHTNSKGTKYYLHSKTIRLKGGNKLQTIYYFSKKAEKNAIDEIPKEFKVSENKRTGLPYLQKNK